MSHTGCELRGGGRPFEGCGLSEARISAEQAFHVGQTGGAHQGAPLLASTVLSSAGNAGRKQLWVDTDLEELRGSDPVNQSRHTMQRAWEHNLIAGSIQFEYDPDELATKITTQLVHKSNSKTYV